jgi:Tfp pilus assembly protein PilV
MSEGDAWVEPMLLRDLTRIRREESGMALVEIVVSAMLLIIVSLGVFMAFDAGTRASAEERHRARAQALAEADIARMQSMRIEQLSTLNQTQNVNQDGTTYQIRSQATFVNEPASTATCAAGTGSRDYINIRSTVTWATIGSRPPVSVTSIVSPPNGSVVPGAGSLLVSVKDADGVGISGVVLNGSGLSSFSGTTGPTGCVLWRNLPAGNYTMSVGGAASGMVDPNGNGPNVPSPRTVSVVAQSTITEALQFDTPGRIQNIRFRTRRYDEALVNSSADQVIIHHSSMDVDKLFPETQLDVRDTDIDTSSIFFPFPSPSAYTIYAGNCSHNNPDPFGLGSNPAAFGSAVVPAGGSGNLLTPGFIQLPALQVTVMSGTHPTDNPGSPVQGGDISVFDDDCDSNPRILTTSTNSSGQVPNGSIGNIGLPYGDNYDICANNSAKTDRRVIQSFDLTSVGTTGTDLTIYIGSTSGGECPP